MNHQSLSVIDYEPSTSDFRADVLAGLTNRPKTLPCKYFYDSRGCQLFEQICELEEYYLTRTELDIMERFSSEMAAAIGPGCMLVEFGSGSSRKTRLLLDQLESPSAYVPVDIAFDHLRESATDLARQYPDVEVVPVCADFCEPFQLPTPMAPVQRRVIYFPGSTIGNFEASDAEELVVSMRHLAGVGGGVLIGFDLKKDTRILEAAYNDSQGVTAEFNLNLLERINRELDADFRLEHFTHRAAFDEEFGRIDIDIVSDLDQTVCIDGETVDFAESEAIRTEHSHKYRLDEFDALAARAGCSRVQAWTDPKDYFAVAFYSVDGVE